MFNHYIGIGLEKKPKLLPYIEYMFNSLKDQLLWHHVQSNTCDYVSLWQS